ncbi:MAG: sugar phosphate nucleotidyltransferase [Candidatus Levyibacteriota bacterium]
MKKLIENHKKIGAIILAAGKGTRMNSKKINKVTLPLADKPMILHSIHLLQNMKIGALVVVVGFAKQSVIKLLDGGIIFAEQRKRNGNARAVVFGLEKLPKQIKDVIVLNGDDSAFYSEKIIKDMIKLHSSSNASLTLLTTEREDPKGLGRIIRDKNEKILSIREEKDASPKQKKIKEVNPACYIFKVSFLKKYLKQVQKSSVTGEYYIVSLVDIGIKHGEKIETLKIKKFPWRGVNTDDELIEAQHLFLKIKR